MSTIEVSLFFFTDWKIIDNSLHLGLYRLLTGLDQMSSQWPETGLMEIDEGGGPEEGPSKRMQGGQVQRLQDGEGEGGVEFAITLCVTLYQNSNPYFPSSHFHFPRPLLCIHYFSIPHSNLDPLIHSQNSICLTLPVLLVSCPFSIYPDQRFHNLILD